MTNPTHDPRRLTQKGDKEIAYPEHAKLTEERSIAAANLMSFLRWIIRDKGYVIAQYDLDESCGDELRSIINDPHSDKVQQLAYEALGIDYDALFREKDVMIQVLRKAQEKSEHGTE